MPLCKYAITNCHFYYDLLKMHKAFWGGVEVSYRRLPGLLRLVGQSRSTVNSTARMLIIYSIHVLCPLDRHIRYYI